MTWNIRPAIVSSIVAGIVIIVVTVGYVKSTKKKEIKHNEIRNKRSSKNTQDENSARPSAKRVEPKLRHKHTVGILDENPVTPEFVMEEIGLIRSNFPHRAGTPRQGTLAPHARSHLILHSTVAPGSLEGLDQYSHLWVIFRFHINIDSEKKSKKKSLTSEASLEQGTRYSAKVKPPRAGGKKVGVLSTRTPHRPNPVGLSLCQIEKIDLKARTIHLLGLDLVDFTPVYDIKPYIPWDSIHYPTLLANSGDSNINTDKILSLPRVPEWVIDDEKIEMVKWTDKAKQAVKEARQNGKLKPLFPPIRSDKQKNKKSKKLLEDNEPEDRTETEAKVGDSDLADEFCEVCEAISEVIAQDPRAIHHGRGTATEELAYSMTFSTLRVYFDVIPSNGSDGEQGKTKAVVVDVVEDPGDITAPVGSYQHSMALRKEAEADALRKGIKVSWKYPIREGYVKGLYELSSGEVYTVEAVDI